MQVSLSRLPSPPREHVVDFPRLDGGLNTWELDYRLAANESPDMENLWWKDGVLCCRDGQFRLTSDELGVGYSASPQPFWGHGFFHIGSRIYYLDLDGVDVVPEEGTLTLTELYDGVPENAGTWFRYGDSLFYKNRGGYIQIDVDEDIVFTASEVSPYVPVVLINTEPTTCAGDKYQPENRLTGTKTVWYSTVSGVKVYKLPVTDVDDVLEVSVDGVVLTSGYTVDMEKGTITFAVEPTHHNPVRVNTVRVTYVKENPDAYDSIMDCPYACVYGGDQNLCVVVAGCASQPNAYFWCGNTDVAMDPGYFPMEQYNFAGDTEETITGFGRQQAMLVIFKTNSVGRAQLGTTEMGNGRVMITMNYTNINSRIGCDLPGTIRLVGNNLVFCNTEQGVHLVQDSSSAHENNIVGISRKVDNGLLKDAREASRVTSYDDGGRYWVVFDDAAYVWDYALSTYKDPSWFYFTAIEGVAFVRGQDMTVHLDSAGRVSTLRRTFVDYGRPINKVYQFSTQSLGGYDSLKDVVSVIFVVRGDTDTVLDVEYLTDYERRKDLTPIVSYNWVLAPRNLSKRYLGLNRFAAVARRRPGCRHVRHFSMRLTNNEGASDMTVISAQIFYKYSGRDR